MEKKCAFVFVVCGAKENIDELNFSLTYIRHFSDYPVFVVTDYKRNSEKIIHDIIINYSTPEKLDHHQASIYLKTRLDKILEPGLLYCYLDSDIVAVNREINEIFEHKKSTISFTSDIVDMRRFSCYAVKCGCMEKNRQRIELLDNSVSSYKKVLREWQKVHKKRIEIKERLKTLIVYWDDHYKIKDKALLEKKKQLERLIPYWDENYRIKDEHLLQKKAYLESIIGEWDNTYKERACQINSMITEWEVKYKVTDPVLVRKRKALLKLLSVTKKQLFAYIKRSIILLLNYKWDKNGNIWYDRQANKLYDEWNEFDNYFRRKGYIWNEPSGKWMTPDGEVYFDKCNEFSAFFFNRGFIWNESDEIWCDIEGNRIIDKKNEFNQFFERHGFYWVPGKKIWYDADEHIIIDEENEFIVYFKRHGFIWDENNDKWFDTEGVDVFDDEDYFGFSNYFKRELGLEYPNQEGDDFEQYNRMHFYAYIRNSVRLEWDEKVKTWLDENNKDILITRCGHLAKAIYEKFEININDKDWLHCNGGVFLFDERSKEFMELWHDYTMQIFYDPYWKTRDQGTLAAVTWKFGQGYVSRIPEKYNFIISEEDHLLKHRSGFEFSHDEFRNTVKPCFIHMMHNYGNKANTVWKEILSIDTD